MFYTRPDSRAAFKADVERMYTDALKVRDAGSTRPAGAPAEHLRTAP